MHLRELRKLFASFGFILVLLLLLVAFSWRNFGRLAEADRRNVHTYEVILQTDRLFSALIDIDTGFRGFIVTGDPRFEPPFEQGRKRFDAQFQKTQATLSRGDNRDRLQQIGALQKQWIVLLTNSMARRRRARTADDAMRIAISGALQRKKKIDAMRALLDEIADIENRLLAGRSVEQRELQRQTWNTLVAGGMFSVFSTLVLATIAGRNTRRLFHTVDALEAAKTNLEDEVAMRQRAQASLAKLNDELRNSNAELEHFAYIASHDLQEPLRAVGGCVQVLKRRYEGKLDERADQLIQHAVDGATRMQTLINDLLLFSRAGSKSGPLVATDLNDVLASVRTALGVAIAETGAHISHDALPVVQVDAGQIAQVLQNLVANAIKFRGESAPEIHIGARRDNAEWIFSVKDKGIGIEPEYFERIFVMFQRLHTRADYPGTGIGLAICKKIIERHSGRIGVESTPGNGATFWFTLPDNAKENG